MPDFNQEISVTVAGVTAIGKSPYGEVAVYAEGSTTAVFGWMTSTDTFVPFEDGTITGDGAGNNLWEPGVFGWVETTNN